MRRSRFFLNTILGVVIAAAACSNEQTGPSQPGEAEVSAAVVALDNLQFLSCTPLSATMSVALIGRNGGTLNVGPHTLVIPRQSLSQDTWITAEVGGALNTIRFGPEGLRFKRGAYLTMSFAGCTGWGLTKQLQIVYTDDALHPLELIPSTTNSSSKTITATLQHFSRYAVAY